VPGIQECRQHARAANKLFSVLPCADYWHCIDKCAAPKLFEQLK
jgi:hypothetical protein